MRFQSILSSGLVVVATLAGVLASPIGDAAEPEILVVATFPEDNPFQHVVNGEKNKLLLGIENKSARNVTIVSVGGSVHHPESGALVKNTTTLTYGIPLLEGTKISLPYSFYSEFKPGDHRLTLWLEHANGEEKYRVQAYDAIMTVVEPPLSVFDFKMISTYLMLAGILGGASYMLYLNFFPQTKKVRKARTEVVSEPVGPVKATGAGGYQEEWIPEGHLPKARRTKSGRATSGDELSAAEASGTEGLKRKGKK